jgi:hypothetical protein
MEEDEEVEEEVNKVELWKLKRRGRVRDVGMVWYDMVWAGMV